MDDIFGALGMEYSLLRESLGGVDMDNTMFDADLGRRVFLRKLADPSLWRRFDIKRFSSLLLPINYRTVFHSREKGSAICRVDGVEKDITGLSPELCGIILALWRDIVALYNYRKTPEEKEKMPDEDFPLENPVVNEFARKMIELDRIIMEIDHILAPLFNNELLLRTRFLAGLNVEKVKVLTKEVMMLRTGDPHSMFTLRTFDENTATGVGNPNQRLSLPDLVLPQVVMVNDLIRRLVSRLFYEYGSDLRVVTTNHQSIAGTAVRHSPYADIKNSKKDGVIGSLLCGTKTRLKAKTDGLPLFGPQKAEVMQNIALRTGRKFLFAFGDSVKNDTPMGIQALVNGGVFGIVGDDYDDTREAFEPVLVRQLKKAGVIPETAGESLDPHPGIALRIWFLKMEPRENEFRMPPSL